MAEVLKLLHESDRRWQTLAAEGEEWRDEERSAEAFIRRRPPGGVISFRGGPDRGERDPRWQLWVRQPDRSRVEFGAAHGARVTEITSADRTWMRLPDGRSHVQQRRPSGRPAFGPASCLVQTRAIPGAFNLEAAGTDDVVGRACVAVRARPVVDETRPGPGFHPLLQGADEVRLTVDAERGVVLRVEALLNGVVFYRNAMTAVRFDEDLPDEIFAFPVADDTMPAAGPARGATGPSRRPPISHPGGPPDDMLGETVPVGAAGAIGFGPGRPRSGRRLPRGVRALRLGPHPRSTDSGSHRADASAVVGWDGGVLGGNRCVSASPSPTVAVRSLTTSRRASLLRD